MTETQTKISIEAGITKENQETTDSTLLSSRKSSVLSTTMDYFQKFEKTIERTEEKDEQEEGAPKKKKKKSDGTSYVIDIVTQVLLDWTDITRENITVKNISGAGGSNTYVATAYAGDESKKKQVCVHIRRKEEQDPITERRMEAAQKTMWEHGVAVPRIISGDYWYIEPFVDNCPEKSTNEDMAKLLADIHRVPTEWFEPFRKELIDMYPHLAEAKLGSHVWLFSTRLEWYNEYKKSWKFWQDAGFEPLSEAARKYVTVHSDFHGGNR